MSHSYLRALAALSADGQVPVFNAASGRFLPGNVAGFLPPVTSAQLITALDNGLELQSGVLYLVAGPGVDVDLPVAPSIGTTIYVLLDNYTGGDVATVGPAKFNADAAERIIGIGASISFTDASVYLEGQFTLIQFTYAGNFGVLPAPTWVAQDYTYDQTMSPTRIAVRAAAGAPLPAYTVSGTGAARTYTADANGALVIDEVTAFASGNHVLLAGEGLGGGPGAANNGIFTVIQNGDAGSPFILRERWDFAGENNKNNIQVFVIDGGTFGHRWFNLRGAFYGSTTDWAPTTWEGNFIEDNALAAGPFNDFTMAGFDGATSFRVQPVTPPTFNGWLAPQTPWSPRRKLIYTTANAVTFAHQNVGSAAENRFISPTGADLVIAADGAAIVEYDPTDRRWRIVSTI